MLLKNSELSLQIDVYYCKNGIVSSGFTHSIHLKNILT